MNIFHRYFIYCLLIAGSKWLLKRLLTANGAGLTFQWIQVAFFPILCDQKLSAFYIPSPHLYRVTLDFGIAGVAATK